MVLQSIGIWSCAKLMGIMYAFMGLIFGGIFSLLSMAGVALNQQGGAAMPQLMAGVGAVIVLPIFYGLVGLIGGAIMAAIYNFIASIIGGIEMNFDAVKRSV